MLAKVIFWVIFAEPEPFRKWLEWDSGDIGTFVVPLWNKGGGGPGGESRNPNTLSGDSILDFCTPVPMPMSGGGGGGGIQRDVEGVLECVVEGGNQLFIGVIFIDPSAYEA